MREKGDMLVTLDGLKKAYDAAVEALNHLDTEKEKLEVFQELSKPTEIHQNSTIRLLGGTDISYIGTALHVTQMQPGANGVAQPAGMSNITLYGTNVLRRNLKGYKGRNPSAQLDPDTWMTSPFVLHTDLSFTTKPQNHKVTVGIMYRDGEYQQFSTAPVSGDVGSRYEEKLFVTPKIKMISYVDVSLDDAGNDVTVNECSIYLGGKDTEEPPIEEYNDAESEMLSKSVPPTWFKGGRIEFVDQMQGYDQYEPINSGSKRISIKNGKLVVTLTTDGDPNFPPTGNYPLQYSMPDNLTVELVDPEGRSPEELLDYLDSHDDAIIAWRSPGYSTSGYLMDHGYMAFYDQYRMHNAWEMNISQVRKAYGCKCAVVCMPWDEMMDVTNVQPFCNRAAIMAVSDVPDSKALTSPALLVGDIGTPKARQLTLLIPYTLLGVTDDTAIEEVTGTVKAYMENNAYRLWIWHRDLGRKYIMPKVQLKAREGWQTICITDTKFDAEKGEGIKVVRHPSDVLVYKDAEAKETARDKRKEQRNGMPMLFLGGTPPKTKTAVKMTFEYIDGDTRKVGWCSIKCQGTSSMAYPKKNFTVKFFSDADLKDTMKIDLGWGKQSTYCLKANWIDITHARNVVSARLWGDVVRSRSDYQTHPKAMQEAPNQGAIDGMFSKVYINGEYQGRYTINIPKGAWMANMDEDNENQAILCGENYGSGCFREPPALDGTDWSDELHDECPEAIKTRWTNAVNFVINADNTSFVNTLSKYFNVSSLIDYFIFALICNGIDNMGKNQIYLTYDGSPWYASMYDLDSTFGLYHNGGSILPAWYRRDQYEDHVDGRQGNLLYSMLEKCFQSEIKKRYEELKKGPLSMASIISRFEQFMAECSPELVAEDYANTTADGAFTGIPSKDTNTLQQIRKFVATRFDYVDYYMQWMGNYAPQVEDIKVNGSTANVAVGETIELSMTATPSNAYVLANWMSSDESILSRQWGSTFKGVREGTAVVTVKCAGHTDSITVRVGDVTKDGYGVLAYKSESPLVFDGTKNPVDTGWAPFDTEGKDWTIVMQVSASLKHKNDGGGNLVHCHMNAGNGLEINLTRWYPSSDWPDTDLNYICGGGNYEYHAAAHGEMTPSTDGYHYIAMAKQGNTIYNYMDGALIEDKGFERTFKGTADNHLFIGGEQNTPGLIGTIVDFRVYDECLSKNMVTALMKTMVLNPTSNAEAPRPNLPQPPEEKTETISIPGQG